MGRFYPKIVFKTKAIELVLWYFFVFFVDRFSLFVVPVPGMIVILEIQSAVLCFHELGCSTGWTGSMKV